MALKQHAGLIVADSEETVLTLIKNCGFTVEDRIYVRHGFTFDREKHRTKDTNNLFVLLMNDTELEQLEKDTELYGAETAAKKLLQLDPAWSIYSLYFNNLRIEAEFDIIAMGTKDFIWKIKHRGAPDDVDKMYFREKPRPRSEVWKTKGE